MRSSVISLFHRKPPSYSSYMVEEPYLGIMFLSLYWSQELFYNHRRYIDIYKIQLFPKSPLFPF